MERPRSMEKAKNRIIQMARDLAPVRQLNVIYSTDRAQAQAIRAELSEMVEPEHLVESRFGPAVGRYLGPNAMGVAVTQGSPDGP